MQRNSRAYFNSNNGESLLFIGEKARLRIDSTGQAIERLDQFISAHAGQYMGVALSYDLKNEIEDLHSANVDNTSFPSAIAFVPESVYELKDSSFTLISGEPVDQIELDKFLESGRNVQKISFQPRTSKEVYLKQVTKLKQHIQQGDIYEVNYCQEYYAEDVLLKDPLSTYHTVNALTKAPYSCYFNFDEFHVISGSPERFIRKKDERLISQPIKGTKKRGTIPEEDIKLVNELKNDPKERSENVMIVDLVRNDLSRLAQKNSVNVDELFGIYTFETVHQMISTISCKLRPNLKFGDILRATFPMGSMTGAPKISAMQLIDEHEDFNRGIFSGSLGYIKPNGDFDLNVIIRTLVYNEQKKYLSCPVGGAITILSDPESEYNECQVKVGRILYAFDGK